VPPRASSKRNATDFWLDMCNRLQTTGVKKIQPYFDLMREYNQPHRFFYRIDYVKDCLIELQNAIHLVTYSYLEQLEFAIWYHRSVYVPGKPDNAECSAEFASRAAKTLGLTQNFQEDVRTLILLTKPGLAPKTPTQKLFVDITHFVFGKPKPQFERYERLIRKESTDTPDKTFAQEHTEFLKGFVDGRFIYHTQYFREKYEHQARINLNRSIRELTAQPASK
jgi:predicted metal-dependent HD superfamily phosphohydrolase